MTRSTLSLSIPLFILIAALLVLNPGIAFAGQYELVRGKQFELCRELIRNFNEFRNAPPLVCERRFSSKYPDFRKPSWKSLDPEQNWSLIMAAQRAFDSRRGGATPERLEQWTSEYKTEVQTQIKQGKFHLFEADFDLARSGEKVRVVMVNDFCRSDNLEQDGAGPALSVIKRNPLEGDARYRSIAGFRGDVFFFQGSPYLATWKSFPSATGRSPAPPRKHDGYILVYETFWLVPQTTDPSAAPSAGYFNEPTCQVGYKR